ncbi:MAG: cytochrome C oxidase subunit IV family protein [Mucilaginibacter sp.]|uniref:cytochrome C oxidase subunit IV family protein n=1 Tax=Mucilaginibacter sp. TaxID=1882438 RepID=UPI003263F78C
MSAETPHIHAEGEHGETLTKGGIVKVLVILLAITAIEFLIALYLAPHYAKIKEYANPVYILLTLFKAYYIVAFFMHLKFEKTSLIYAIVVPTLFIIGLILVLTNESHYWFQLRF